MEGLSPADWRLTEKEWSTILEHEGHTKYIARVPKQPSYGLLYCLPCDVLVVKLPTCGTLCTTKKKQYKGKPHACSVVIRLDTGTVWPCRVHKEKIKESLQSSGDNTGEKEGVKRPGISVKLARRKR